MGIAGCDKALPDATAARTATVSLHVEGMMCAESCARTVQKILSEQAGVQAAAVDYEAKRASCKVDAATFDVDAAIAELADQDFIATVQE
jgi:copper chaperone CopZ